MTGVSTVKTTFGANGISVNTETLVFEAIWPETQPVIIIKTTNTKNDNFVFIILKELDVFSLSFGLKEREMV